MSTKMSTSNQRGRVTLAVMFAAALIAILPALPAAAGNADGGFQGTATLNAGISAPCLSNVHSGTFSGTFAGVHGGSPAAGGMSATYKYCNSTTIAGTAEGNFTVDGDNCGFTWVRTGATAAITISGGGDNCSGSATAVFVPTSVPGAVPGTAEVAGTGSWTH